MAIKVGGTTVIDDSLNITTDVGTVDGRDIAADGAKLDALDGTLTLDASGNVGIGTAVPLAALHVTTSTTDYTGDVVISGSRPYLVLDDNTSGQNGFSIGVDGGVVAFGQGDFSANSNVYGTERMRIDASGNLLVGTTSGSDKVTVNGTVSATSFTGNGAGLTNLPAAVPSLGAVGSYVFAFNKTATSTQSAGSTASGSNLVYPAFQYGTTSTNYNTSIIGGYGAASGLSGTWRAHNRFRAQTGQGGTVAASALWLRIA